MFNSYLMKSVSNDDTRDVKGTRLDRIHHQNLWEAERK